MTSANVACGFHAGDPPIVAGPAPRRPSAGVPSARTSPTATSPASAAASSTSPRTELTDDVVYQIGALQALARRARHQVRYVKPHGALYNAIVHHEEQAAGGGRRRARRRRRPAPAGAARLRVARQARAAGLREVPEAFADRALHRRTARSCPAASPAPSCTTPRRSPPAWCGWPSRARSSAVDGSLVAVDAQSHLRARRHPRGVAMAARVRRALEAAGVRVGSFL